MGITGALKSVADWLTRSKPVVVGGPKPDLGKRSSKWASIRAAQLKSFPTCAACGSKDFLEVHHILPFHKFPALELDEDNLVTLCEGTRGCHFCFGHAYSWKGWVDTVREDAARHLKNVQESRRRAT